MSKDAKWFARFNQCVTDCVDMSISVTINPIEHTVLIQGNNNAYQLPESDALEFIIAVHELMDELKLSSNTIAMYLAWDFIGYIYPEND